MAYGIDVLEMAKEFHRIYEEEASLKGWKTQESCKVPFDKLPEKNKKVMLHTCARIIEWIRLNSENIGNIHKIQ